MLLEKVNSIDAAPIIFEIVKQAFNRPFDKCPANINEVIDYIKDSDVYVLKDNDEYIGYFILKEEPLNVCELKSVAIPQKYQGKKYGSFLIKKVLEITKGKKIHCVTHPKNTNGLFMYLKNGFEITGWIDNYLGDGQPRLRLEKQN